MCYASYQIWFAVSPCRFQQSMVWSSRSGAIAIESTPIWNYLYLLYVCPEALFIHSLGTPLYLICYLQHVFKFSLIKQGVIISQSCLRHHNLLPHHLYMQFKAILDIDWNINNTQFLILSIWFHFYEYIETLVFFP